jgi:PASTA domain/FG-GAP-like repeat/FG-GAP repeat
MARDSIGRARLRGVRGASALLSSGAAALAVAVVSIAAPSAPVLARPKSYATGVAPWSVAIGNLDGGSEPDLAVANSSNLDTVSVLLNKLDGTFYPRREYATGKGSIDVAIGDLTGDGNNEIVTANADASTISVLVNEGRGRTFVSRRDHVTGRSPVSVEMGDVNGDGHLDVVTANFDAQTASVLVNNGDGTFKSKVDYRTGLRPESVALADANGDRALDIATANRSDSISVLLNTGAGAFSAHVDYRAGSGPRSIAVGDLNGDRKPDIATANHNVQVDGVSVLLNAGEGTFRPKRDYRPEALACSCSIAIGDLNGDRRPELVVGNEFRADVSVFVNRGEGSFQRPIQFRTGREPISVALGDLDRDRELDVVTADSEADTVSVLRNRTKLCRVPNVVAKTLAAASQAIKRARCRVGNVSRAYSRTIPSGRVVSQQPPPATTLPPGGKINLVISRGRSR